MEGVGNFQGGVVETVKLQAILYPFSGSQRAKAESCWRGLVVNQGPRLLDSSQGRSINQSLQSAVGECPTAVGKNKAAVPRNVWANDTC